MQPLVTKILQWPSFLSQGQYAEALKGYQDAVEEMKSPDRNEAKLYLQSHEPS